MNTQKFPFGLIPIVVLTLVAACVPVPAAPPAAPPAASAPTIAPPQATTAAPEAQLEKVTLAYGGPVPAVLLLPIDVAAALDLFKQEGLDVTMTRMPRLNANDKLLLGQVDFAGEVFNPSDTQAAGRQARSVVSLAQLPGFTLVVRSDLKETIKSVADLKGHQVAYGGKPGIFPYVVSKAGLNPADVQWLENGRNVAQIAADMAKGTGEAAILVEPYTTPLLQSGKAVALVDLTAESDTLKWLGGEYQSVNLMATTETIEKRPHTVQAMTNALVQALRFIATHNPTELATLLPEAVTGKDKALYAEVLQRSLPMFSKNGIVNPAAVQTTIDVNRAMGSLKPDQKIDPGSLYTNEFVNNANSAITSAPAAEAPSAASPVEFVRSIDNPADPLHEPSGMAIDNQGNLYVADASQGTIQKFDRNGNFIVKWGSLGPKAGQLDCDGFCALAVDAGGNVYATDTANRRIEKFDSNGKLLLQWGQPGEFQHAHGVTVDVQGNVYVMEHSRSNVLKYEGAGHALLKWGDLGSAEGAFGFRSSPSIAVSPQGNVYVPDGVNRRIQVFDSNGKFLRAWPGCAQTDPQGQNGIAVDANENVYVTNGNENLVCKFDHTGTLLWKWGKLGNGQGEFSGPWAITLDAQGDIFVSDLGTERVQEFRQK